MIEQGPESWGAYVPDLPGCAPVAKERDEIERLTAEAIAFHIEGLKQGGEPVPPPTSTVTFVEVPAA